MAQICGRTGKRKFDSELEANIAVAAVQLRYKKHRSQSHLHTEPQRSYRCEFCDQWHMTGQDKHEPAQG